MKLKEHLPPLLQGVDEYEALCETVESELDRLRAGIEEVRQNLIVSTAEEEGLSRFERALGLVQSGSFADRRAAILARMVDLPYSEPRVRARLAAMVGENGFQMLVNGQSIKLLLSLEAKSAFDAVSEVLRAVLPANTTLVVELKLTTNAQLAALTHQALSEFTHEEMRNEVACNG